MISMALSGFGTLLKLGDGGSPTQVFARVGELKNLSGPKISTDALETTVHNSPTPVRRFIPGLMQFGDISLSINFNPQEPTHGMAGGLLFLQVNRQIRDMQIVFPDDGNTTWEGAVFVTNFEVSADPAALLLASVTLKVAGGMTLA